VITDQSVLYTLLGHKRIPKKKKNIMSIIRRYVGRRANIKKWPENIDFPGKNFGATPPLVVGTTL